MLVWRRAKELGRILLLRTDYWVIVGGIWSFHVRYHQVGYMYWRVMAAVALALSHLYVLNLLNVLLLRVQCLMKCPRVACHLKVLYLDANPKASARPVLGETTQDPT